jgi:hypothetical protein
MMVKLNMIWFNLFLGFAWKTIVVFCDEYHKGNLLSPKNQSDNNIDVALRHVILLQLMKDNWNDSKYGVLDDHTLVMAFKHIVNNQLDKHNETNGVDDNSVLPQSPGYPVGFQKSSSTPRNFILNVKQQFKHDVIRLVNFIPVRLRNEIICGAERVALEFQRLRQVSLKFASKIHTFISDIPHRLPSKTEVWSLILQSKAIVTLARSRARSTLLMWRSQMTGFGRSIVSSVSDYFKQ